jgi:hypothetical protein
MCPYLHKTNVLIHSPASEEKFRSLYKIADTVDFQEAVIKLVSLVQTALYLFKLLDKDYIDGLICNETTNALWIFYTKYDPIKTTEVNHSIVDFFYIIFICICICIYICSLL